MVHIYERNILRQLMGVTTILLRWPILSLLAVYRHFKTFNCIFTVYPGSMKDVEGYVPSTFKELFKSMTSGKPFVAGIITSGNGYGRGLILAVPNTVEQFKVDRMLVGRIMRRLNFVRNMMGAKTISIAGQGPRYFKSHFPYEQPFVYGLRGRVFSVMETVEKVFETHQLSKDKASVVLLGIGEIGEAIIRNLMSQGYNITGVNIHVREGGVEIDEAGFEALMKADVVVVQTPRGDDVVRYYSDLKKTAILVDDSHPRLTKVPKEIKFYKVAIGRPGVQFIPPLPGYRADWIPGCVQESMVVAETGHHDLNQDEFNRRSKELGFFVHLTG